MGARQDADLDLELTDVLRAASVRPKLLVDDRGAELVLEHGVPLGGDLLGRDLALRRDELLLRLVLQVVEALLALGLVGVAELRPHALDEELAHRAELGLVADRRRPLHFRLAGGAPELLLGLAELHDALLGEGERLDELVLADLVRAGLDHHDRVLRARDHEVELALEHLLDRWVEGERAVDGAHANAADRSLERSVRDVERGRRGVHREHVVVVLLVARPRRHDDLDVVLEALRPERPDRAVDEPGGEDALLGWPALPARERAGDLARGVEALFEVDGQREEVDAETRLRDRAGGEDDRVAVTDRDRASGLARVLAGLEGQGLVVDGRLRTCDCHVCIYSGASRGVAYLRRPSRPMIS